MIILYTVVMSAPGAACILRTDMIPSIGPRYKFPSNARRPTHTASRTNRQATPTATRSVRGLNGLPVEVRSCTIILFHLYSRHMDRNLLATLFHMYLDVRLPIEFAGHAR
jgi:hypothetical protein